MTAAVASDTEISVSLNGATVKTRAGTLAALVETQGFGGLKVATAVNGNFVPERKRAETRLSAGDAIEVVAPRQGG